ncbi:hypothetical protein GLOIN_2v1530555 [Rhizophagus clarus]|uniref:Uncharacterized protein n=1 Tax=Rhizophagus clarus TaxID=94130 RepID=A0A8H3QPJ2_9GLOM|nr:hypothetical protein GLOIN_2v1530555 [Rhizophagus clarus]
MGPAYPVVDSNEAICCEYILTILYAAISLLKDLFILFQMTVTGAESSRHMDYAIKNHRWVIQRNNLHNQTKE